MSLLKLIILHLSRVALGSAVSSRLLFVKENQSFFTEFSPYILMAAGLTKYLNASTMEHFPGLRLKKDPQENLCCTWQPDGDRPSCRRLSPPITAQKPDNKKMETSRRKGENKTSQSRHLNSDPLR